MVWFTYVSELHENGILLLPIREFREDHFIGVMRYTAGADSKIVSFVYVLVWDHAVNKPKVFRDPFEKELYSIFR